MTLTDSANTPTYPTEWHVIDEIYNTECRQLTDDTFQLRNDLSVLTLNKEGFDLYRNDTEEGYKIFLKWLAANSIIPVPRKPEDE